MKKLLTLLLIGFAGFLVACTITVDQSEFENNKDCASYSKEMKAKERKDGGDFRGTFYSSKRQSCLYEVYQDSQIYVLDFFSGEVLEICDIAKESCSKIKDKYK